MKRPFAITLIGWLLLLEGLLTTIVSGLGLTMLAAVLFEVLPAHISEDFVMPRLPELGFVPSAFVLGIFSLVSSIGLLRLRAWGWLMTMIVQGISLIIGLAEYVQGEANYLRMLFSVVIVFFLNQRTIKQVFEIITHTSSATHQPTTRHVARNSADTEEPLQDKL